MANIQARLRPYDPTKGHVRRGLTISKLGLSFDDGKVVSGIKPHEADVLRTIRQRDDDPNTPLAFDVLEESEMKALLNSEARAKLGINPEVLDIVRESLAKEPPVAEAAPKPTRRRAAPQPASPQ